MEGTKSIGLKEIGLKNIVDMMIKDDNFVKNWTTFHSSLPWAYPDFIQLEISYNNTTVGIRQVLMKLLGHYISTCGKTATIGALQEILLNDNFVSVSEALDELRIPIKKPEIQRDYTSAICAFFAVIVSILVFWFLNTSGTTSIILKHPVFQTHTLPQNYTNPTTSTSIFPIRYGIGKPIKKFVGRRRKLDQLEKIRKDSKHFLIVITGLSGIGKTELVRTFITGLLNSTINCVWLNGEDPQSLKSSITQLQADLNPHFSHQYNNLETNFVAIKRILSTLIKLQSSPAPWIIILDNVDESHDDIESILEYLVDQQILTIITSTNQKILRPNDAIFIPIEKLDDQDVIEFVKSSLNNDQESDDDILQLCNIFDNHPLALEQAVAYILEQRRDSPEGIAYFIRNYITQVETQLVLQSTLGYQLSKISNKYGKSALSTLQISIDKIQQKYPALGNISSDILNILAFVKADGIQLAFLETIYSQIFAVNSTLFSQTISLLKTYSLIKVDNLIVTVHRLVQQVVRIHFSNSSPAFLNQLTSSAAILSQTFQRSEILHVLEIWNHALKDDKIIFNIHTLSFKIYHKLINLTMYSEALSFSKNNYDKFYSLLGYRSISTLFTLHNIGLSSRLTGNYAQSFEILVELYKKESILLGPESPETTSTCHDVGVVLYNLAKYTATLIWDYFVLAKEIRLYGGQNNEHTMKTITNIGVVLLKLNRYKEAKIKFEQVLAWQMDHLGKTDPSTLVTLNNLAGCHYKMGNYAKAKMIFESILKTKIQIFGETNEATLFTKSWLAKTLDKMGETEKALTILKQVLPLRENILGVNHPYTVSTRNRIRKIEGRDTRNV